MRWENIAYKNRLLLEPCTKHVYVPMDETDKSSVSSNFECTVQ